MLFSLSAFKKLENPEKKDFKEKIHCLTQNSIKIDREKVGNDILEKETFVSYVPIDGKASEATRANIIAGLPKDLKVLPLPEIVYFGKILDAQKSASDYRIEYDFVCPQIGEGEVKWAYGLKEYERDIDKICPRTFRPYSEHENMKWEDSYEKFFKIPITSVFKGRKYL